MATYLPVPEPPTPGWLTGVLRDAGWLAAGEVGAVSSTPTGAFNSRTLRLQVQYTGTPEAALATQLILKRNIRAPWGIQAGQDEAHFYQLIAELNPPPPAILTGYAAAVDAASGDSYLLLPDLSATHAPPVSRAQQIGLAESVPAGTTIRQVTQALAQHHAYWWDHSELFNGRFEIGYWSRNAERFAQYWQRRHTAWEDLRANEASWLPGDLLALYEIAFAGLRWHWEHDLAPRFQRRNCLTLLHGDAYFANFLCPRPPTEGVTYLLDWQSPSADIGAYDLANLCATFWTPAQRNAGRRERQVLREYLEALNADGVTDYTWDDLVRDYQAGLIYWLLVPLQDRLDGSPKDYWWPKMQCLAAAFREWNCASRLGSSAVDSEQWVVGGRGRRLDAEARGSG